MLTNGYHFDDGVTTFIDDTTDANYTYIYKSLNASADPTVTTKKDWICKRITDASGTSSFANGVSDFLRPEKFVTIASGLTATYTA